MPALSKFLHFARRFAFPKCKHGEVHAVQAAAQCPHRWPLDMPLLTWRDGEPPFRLSDAVCGLHVWGVTGSGKSLGTIFTVANSYLANGFGAVFLTAKPTDAATYLDFARRCGREKDVVLLGPRHPATFSFLNEAARGGAGLVANVTSMLSLVSNLALGAQGGGESNGGNGGREDGSYWVRMEMQLTTCCAELLMLAGEPVTTINIERLVTSMPSSLDEANSEGWQRGSYLYDCLRRADEHATDPEDREDLRRLLEYFAKFMPSLSEKTRSTVASTVLATCDSFNRQLTRRLIGSPAPTFDMDMLLDGKVLIVDMDVLTFGALARVVQVTMKECFHLAMNRRDTAANSRPVMLCADESQMTVDLSRDASFQTTARASRACVVYATQSISNYLSEHGQASEARTHALLGNFVTQVFHNSTDPKMIEYAQSLGGRRKTLFMSGGTQQQPAPPGEWVSAALGFGQASTASAGFSEQFAPLVEASDFHALAKGGPQSDWIIEALITAGGRTWNTTGSPFLPVRFQQERPRVHHA